MDVVIPATRKEAKLAVFDYIETFFNSKRRPRSLGQISPVAFEQKYEKLKIKPA
jgi:putative transposase